MILVFAGTSDARELALQIQAAGYNLQTSVVTDNAAKTLQDAGLPVRVGRLTAQDTVDLIAQLHVEAIVDASHPYAEEASKNAMDAAIASQIPYFRFEREALPYKQHPNVILVADYAEAAEVAAAKQGVVMLTTGSKTLKIFTDRLLGLPDTTLVARMLPVKENMEKCEALGIEQKNIVAMQGPFSKDLNKALYDHYKVTIMITKESGKVGAVDEKVESALEMGIEVIVIDRPKIAYGLQYSDYASVLNELNRNFKGGTE